MQPNDPGQWTTTAAPPRAESVPHCRFVAEADPMSGVDARHHLPVRVDHDLIDVATEPPKRSLQRDIAELRRQADLGRR